HLLRQRGEAVRGDAAVVFGEPPYVAERAEDLVVAVGASERGIADEQHGRRARDEGRADSVGHQPAAHAQRPDVGAGGVERPRLGRRGAPSAWQVRANLRVRGPGRQGRGQREPCDCTTAEHRVNRTLRRATICAVSDATRIRSASEQVSELTTARLSVYLRCLEALDARGVNTISSQGLETEFGLNAAQIRKDLAHFGEFGIRGVGYYVKDLKRHLRQILGLDRAIKVIIVGAGNLGLALADYQGFRADGFHIVALFDVAAG